MADTFDALTEKLRLLDQQGEASTEKVDLLVAAAKALHTNDPPRLRALGQEAYDLAVRLSYQTGQAYGLGYMGFADYLLSNHENAHALFKRSIALFEETDDIDGRAKSWGGLAGVQMSLGRYDEAVANAMEALKLFRQTGNRFEEAWMLNGLGVGYTEFGAFDRALDFQQHALAIFDELHEGVGKARALTGIGTIYHRQGDYAQALPYHTQSLHLFRAEKNAIGEARALNDLGVVHQHLGDLDQALQYHHESLAIREAQGNRQAQSTSLIHLGDIYLQQDNVEQALEVLQRALVIAEATHARQRIYQAHSGLADAYEYQGNLAAALRHHRAFHHVREAVQGEETQAAINTLSTRFEVEKSEREAENERLRNIALKEKNEALERVLHELKTTQAQLIQAEKMASLGQLTAGVAHEIKNPLNFINNFAELAGELADELIEVLHTHRDTPVADVFEDVEDLVDALRASVKKIEVHGNRADGIVQSMMQHASGGKGKRKEVDLNPFVDEYVNLAYHGLCARLPEHDVKIERDYDARAGTITLVPQDMGRVLVNLLNNAFDAVHERFATETGVIPTVTVTTTREEDHIKVCVADNGEGIEEALQKKIFEPFFTTKPTGSGTGLGLSISYDIVTQGHGGTLTVASAEDNGASFIVTLPLHP